MLSSRTACRIGLRQAFLFFLTAIAAPFRSLAQQPDQTQAPAIRLNVSRVNVGVIATNSAGKFVEDLTAKDFHVLDNGVEQPIVGFLANDDPAQVFLMLECGPSLRLFGTAYVQRAAGLIRNLAPNDRVAIICYSSTPEVQLDLTADKPAALVALASINFDAGFADLNLSKSLFNVLSRLDSLQGKKTIVLLSSGIDTSPPLVPEDFLARLSTTDVRILAICTSKLLTQTPKHHVLSLEQKSGRANLQSSLMEGENKLRELATATGGRVYFPKSLKDFDRTYAEIAQLVRHEYNLAFVPQTFDGKLHSLSVTAKHAHRLDHRQAYLASSDSSH